jgi:hypothetical protein
MAKTDISNDTDKKYPVNLSEYKYVALAVIVPVLFVFILMMTANNQLKKVKGKLAEIDRIYNATTHRMRNINDLCIGVTLTIP